MSRRLPLAVLIVCAGLAAAAQPPLADADKKGDKPDPNGILRKPDPPTGRPMELGECLALAEQRQPRIRAAQHSLRAAELGLQGLSGLGRIADQLSPDLPVRRQQSILGLQVGRSAVDQVRQETVSDVCEMYYSHVYARQSEQTAFDVVVQLDTYYTVAKELLESGAGRDQLKGLTKQTLYNLQAVIAEVKLLRFEAETGRRKSLFALKEAMGVGPECDFHPAAKELPIMNGELSEVQVVGWALQRRPELAQAAAGVEVFNLEPVAQGLIRIRPQVNTLAAGTDLHSRGVPLPLRNGQYRPGALAPEMPNSMVGRTDDRVARACELAGRQSALYETTAGLVRLEAESAFVEWEQTTKRMAIAKDRFEATQQAFKEAETAATARGDAQLLVQSQAVAGKAQADYVRAVFDHVKALVKLERVTAGGVRLGFPGR